MSNNKQMLKLFVVLFFSTTFIFSSSHFAAKAVEGLSKVDGKFAEGTTIGMINISGKTKEEAVNLLEEKYVEWMKGISFEMLYGDKSAPFDVNLFELDSSATVAAINDGQKNTANITVDKAMAEEQLKGLFPLLKAEEIDWEKLTQTLNQIASLFEPGTHSYKLYPDYLIADQIKDDVVISETVVQLDNAPSELLSIVNQTLTIEIAADATFSLLGFAANNKLTDTKTLNLLATGIYQAVLASNFEIVERNISSSLPGYAKLGYEAMVIPDKKVDLVVKNPNMASYFLEMQVDNNQLKVALKGQKLLYSYKLTVKDEQKLTPKTIIQYSSSVKPGKTKIQTNGEDGQIIKLYRDIYQDSQFIKSEFVSEDYYPANYKVEIHGLAASTESPATGTTDGTKNTESSNSTIAETNSAEADPKTTDSDIWGKPNEQPK
ncbi:VanW family protein [Neobacillus niacini]|uniref:VanW family protein n=1 Tax=Neobacillus niacini TaxID=86668 RepID=UPI0021CB2266|nr:VanW family protein [Neobacillus niacini]MCM3765454.1 VanW family protein [Neobacillus niacini]